MTSEGRHWRRRVGTTEWKRADSPPSTASLPMELSLVRQEQSICEPHHWLLLLARENQLGSVFHVKEDAVAMRYTHNNNVNVLNS